MATGTSAQAEPESRRSVRFLFTGEGRPYLLVPLILVVLELVHAAPTWVFLASALGVIPTVALMGRATEEPAARPGSRAATAGGLRRARPDLLLRLRSVPW